VGAKDGHSRSVHGNARPPETLPAGTGRRQTRTHAVSDKLSLKLRDAGEDPEHKPAVGRRGVHAFMQAHELDPQGAKFLKSVHERHLFFTPNGKPVKNSTGKLGPHLDVRGTGGYVVLPPSIHESGKKYQWGNHFKPEPLPEWLAALLADSPRQQALPDAGEKIPQGQ